MSIVSKCVRPMFAVAVVGLLAGPALGQAVIQLTVTQIAGKIAKVGRGAVLVKTANDQNWTVRLTPKTMVKVTGSAEPDMLTPGACVHFVATIDKRTSRGQDKIDQLTIFTETPGDDDRTLGVMRASDKPPKEEHRLGGPGGPGPGGPAGPGPGGPGGPPPPNFADPDGPNGKKPPRSRSAKQTVDKSGPEAESFDISAQVVSFHAGRLIVTVQNKYFKPRVTVELDPAVKIALDLNDLSHVAPGDAITARGVYATPGMAEAIAVHIELAKPLGAPRSRHYLARTTTGKDHTAKAGKADAKSNDKPVAKHGKGKDDSEIPEMPAEAVKPAEDAAVAADQDAEIARFLAPTPAEQQGRSGFPLRVGGGAAEFYKPCKQVLTKDLRTKFGPTKSPPMAIQGQMPDGNGQMKQVNWEIWVYGKVKIIVDEHSQTSYMAGAPEVAAGGDADKEQSPAEKSPTEKSPNGKPAASDTPQPAPADAKPHEEPPASKPADKGEDKDVFEK